MIATKSRVLEEIANMTVWELESFAECGSPDTESSAGALFLLAVKAAFLESMKENDCVVEYDEIHEIADGAPDIYTHRRWLEFVDLCAYEEDIYDYVSDETSMTDRAGVALYLIARRLLEQLAEAYRLEVSE
jgi:hypothetical protein